MGPLRESGGASLRKDGWNCGYTSAVESGDEALANERMRQFYKLDSVVHGKQNAISYGFMDGLGILPLEKAWMNVIGRPEGAKGFQDVEAGMQKAAEMYPVLNSEAFLAGRYAQLRTPGELTGMGLNALGASGPYVPYIRAGLTFGASQAIQESGDLATGRITLPEYLNHLSKAEKQGMLAQALGELFAVGYYGAHYGGHGIRTRPPLQSGWSQS